MSAAGGPGQPARRRGGLHGPGEVTTDIIDQVLFQTPAKGQDEPDQPEPPAEAEEQAE